MGGRDGCRSSPRGTACVAGSRGSGATHTPPQSDTEPCLSVHVCEGRSAPESLMCLPSSQIHLRVWPRHFFMCRRAPVRRRVTPRYLSALRPPSCDRYQGRGPQGRVGGPVEVLWPGCRTCARMHVPHVHRTAQHDNAEDLRITFSNVFWRYAARFGLRVTRFLDLWPGRPSTGRTTSFRDAAADASASHSSGTRQVGSKPRRDCSAHPLPVTGLPVCAICGRR